MADADITCREFVEFLADYEDGELPAARRACFEQHLGECPDCIEYLSEYRATVRIARQAGVAPPDGGPPPEAPRQLIDAILAALRRS